MNECDLKLKRIYFLHDTKIYDKINIQSDNHLEDIKKAVNITSFTYNELSKYTHILTHMGYTCVYIPNSRL
jgi:hypothetical protein